MPFRGNCYELLGYDILVDAMLEPWLIEVNLSPSLGCDSALDQRIKAALVSDLFTLTGVVPLDRRQNLEKTSFKKPGMLGLYSNIPAAAQTLKKKKKKDKLVDKVELVKSQADAVKDTEQEFKRRGGFKRIFPNIDFQYYKQFFTAERILNTVVDAKVMDKRRLTTENTNLLKQKIVEKQSRMTF